VYGHRRLPRQGSSRRSARRCWRRASTSTSKSRCRGASRSAATSGPCAAVRIARGVRLRHFLRCGLADSPRGPNTLSRIFHDHFDSFAQSYDCLCAKDFGRFHLERISCVLPCQCRKSAGTRTRTPALGSHLRGRHLLARVYEIDIWACPVYCGRISVIAVILDPAKIRKIIACLSKHSRGPPTEE